MCLSIAFLLIFTTFRRSLKKNPSEKSSWQLLSVFGTTCLGITFLLTFCWSSSQCQPLSIVVLQAVNKLRSQHWSKRANIIWWYCTRFKKTVHQTYMEQSVFLRKYICALWVNIAVWKTLTKQYSYAMLFQNGRYNIV